MINGHINSRDLTFGAQSGGLLTFTPDCNAAILEITLHMRVLNAALD